MDIASRTWASCSTAPRPSTRTIGNWRSQQCVYFSDCESTSCGVVKMNNCPIINDTTDLGDWVVHGTHRGLRTCGTCSDCSGCITAFDQDIGWCVDEDVLRRLTEASLIPVPAGAWATCSPAPRPSRHSGGRLRADARAATLIRPDGCPWADDLGAPTTTRPASRRCAASFKAPARGRPRRRPRQSRPQKAQAPAVAWHGRGRAPARHRRLLLPSPKGTRARAAEGRSHAPQG